MSEKTFFIYEGVQIPGLYAFKEKQPQYLMKDCVEYKCISVDKDIDSYIYFIQHQSDVLKKENKELARKLEVAKKALIQSKTRLEYLETVKCHFSSGKSKCNIENGMSLSSVKEALKELE